MHLEHFLVCRACAGDDVQLMPGSPGREAMRGARVTTETVQLMRCLNGHRFALILQDGGYALLYERALQRLAIGHLRDAVLDAYTALDMCMGQVLLRHLFEARKGSSSLAQLRDEFSYVLHRAERTWGAALVVASMASGRTPPKIPTKLHEIRNNAAHEGEYPTEEKAEWACMQVARIVWELGAMPRPQHDDPFFHALVAERLPSIQAQAPGHQMSVMLMTVLGSIGTRSDPEVAKVRLDDYRDGEWPLSIT